jgi:hypothetical protein
MASITTNTLTVPTTPEEFIQLLRSMRELIPDFVQLAAADKTTLSRVAAVDEIFVRTTIQALGDYPVLKSALGRPADDLLQDTDFAVRWGAVADELASLLSGVNAAIMVRKYRSGLIALQAYHISRQLVRHKEHALLLPHFNAMKRRMKFGRSRAKKVEGQPQPGPKPEPQPVR